MFSINNTLFSEILTVVKTHEGWKVYSSTAEHYEEIDFHPDFDGYLVKLCFSIQEAYDTCVSLGGVLI